MSLDELNRCLEEKQYDQALVHCDTLMAQEEPTPQMRAIKGWCLHKTGDSYKATKWLLDAFDREPSNPNVMTMTVSLFMDLADYPMVIELCQRCAAFFMDDRLLWHRFGTSHYLVGDFGASISAFRRSLKIKSSATTTFGMSMPLLQTGQYREGFLCYESRIATFPKLDWLKSHKLPMPKWAGESLKGKSILLWSEQGLGDSIQFFRFVTVLAEQGAEVDIILHGSHASLKDVLSTVKGMGKVMVVNGNTVKLERTYDYHSSVMSVMYCLGLSTHTIPSTVPYISIPSDHKLDWEPEPSAQGKLKVGLVWTTQLKSSFLKNNALHYFEKNKKNVPFESIRHLFSIEDACFYSLHYQLPDNTEKLLEGYSVRDLSPVISDFSDTAAIIEKMDIVISIDTSVVHLAGALGKPTINILPYTSDWRWQQHREDSPWYPSMRLLQQIWPGEWDAVIDRVEKMLLQISKDYKETGKVNIFQF